uniref:Uncharacterized protein n=1 Tax=Oryza sativa subsp. japonica TaxID=39947 RepID=Q6Z5Q8_ORYSJ|nr:hypothetical protein [Oryza sativa Japonica Group]
MAGTPETGGVHLSVVFNLRPLLQPRRTAIAAAAFGRRCYHQDREEEQHLVHPSVAAISLRSAAVTADPKTAAASTSPTSSSVVVCHHPSRW